MAHLRSCLALLSLVAFIPAHGGERDSQIETILADLTLDEKVGQLNLVAIEGGATEEQLQMIRDGKIGHLMKSHGAENNLQLQRIAVEESRSGVPLLFHEDVIHGYKTVAPVPLAEAASWDLKAIRESAATAAREASAAGIQLTYAPMVDVTREPRWGRIMEAAGEDPYLGARVAEARVRGFQESGDMPEMNLLACVKHYAGYGASLAGRDYNVRDLSERELREVHLPPFQAAIDAGVACVMGAYSAYDGIPVTANNYLMRDVLRDEMGFAGLVMTDWATISNLVKTGIAADDKSAVKMAMDAGFDIDMSSERYLEILPDLVRSGVVSEEQLDNAVRQVLLLKKKAGLLDDPYSRFDAGREQAQLMSRRNWAATKDIALKSIVLLKNENATLPITDDVKRIAVIGPYARARRPLLGWWHSVGEADDVVSIFDGLRREIDDSVELLFASGVTIDGFEKSGEELIPEAADVAGKADLVILVLGEEHWMSGEGGGTASLHLPGLQEELLAAIADRVEAPIATVVITGRPYVLTDVAEHSDALLQAWMPGTTGGEAVAEILSGKFNPSAKLPATFPYHQGQVPIFYGYKKTSHIFDAGPDDNRYTATYRDVQSEPLYPFGYGLSYTTFEYSDITLSDTEMEADGEIEASVTITNSGGRAGREIVQLYIHDRVSSVTRPLKELKDFALIDLDSGESRKVSFILKPDELAFVGRELKMTIEPGEFDLYIGRSSADYKSATFRLN